MSYTYPGFKTAELNPIYRMKSEFVYDKNRWVTLPGIEPGFKA